MSEIPAGLTFMEKLFGLILIAIGALVINMSRTTESIDAMSASFAIFFGVIFIALGIFAIIIKHE